jgi:hypothetical protein
MYKETFIYFVKPNSFIDPGHVKLFLDKRGKSKSHKNKPFDDVNLDNATYSIL